MAVYEPGCHPQNSLRFGPYTILWVTDRSINCHLSRKKTKQSLKIDIIWSHIIIYNYCTSLSAIWCVMEHWKAILTKVLHNTSYCTKWSAVIVLLHLTFHVFCVYLENVIFNAQKVTRVEHNIPTLLQILWNRNGASQLS
jgi:hypothetical protein